MKTLNINVSLVKFGLLTSLLCGSSLIQAATLASLQCTGATSGLITQNASSPESIGTLARPSLVDASVVLTSNYQVAIPAGGGARVHRPLIVTKLVDRASPIFLQALSANEQLQCTLSIYRTSPTGASELYYKIAISDALVTALNMKQSDTFSSAAEPDTETLALSYRSITITHVPALVSVTD